jgi:hypothetical protein
VSKRIDDMKYNKFISDVKILRSIYTDAKIATEMQSNSGNFSSYVNKSKRPGQDFIDRFYRVWGKKLSEIMEGGVYANVERGMLAVKEVSHTYEHRPPTRLSTDQDERLQRIEENISQLHSIVGDLMRRLMESNQKLIDAQLSSRQHEEKEGSSLTGK